MDLITIKRDGQYAILSLTDVAAALLDHVKEAKGRGFNDVNMQAAADILIEATRTLNKILHLYDCMAATPHRLFHEGVIERAATDHVSGFIKQYRDKEITLEQFKAHLTAFIHGPK